MGSTGEYSDHTEWLVAAYYSKEKARELVINAGNRANELFSQFSQYGRFSHNIPAKANKFDPGMQMDYTGVRYYINETEVKDKPSKIQTKKNSSLKSKLKDK